MKGPNLYCVEDKPVSLILLLLSLSLFLLQKTLIYFSFFPSFSRARAHTHTHTCSQRNTYFSFSHRGKDMLKAYSSHCDTRKVKSVRAALLSSLPQRRQTFTFCSVKVYAQHIPSPSHLLFYISFSLSLSLSILTQGLVTFHLSLSPNVFLLVLGLSLSDKPRFLRPLSNFSLFASLSLSLDS